MSASNIIRFSHGTWFSWSFHGVIVSDSNQHYESLAWLSTLVSHARIISTPLIPFFKISTGHSNLNSLICVNSPLTTLTSPMKKPLLIPCIWNKAFSLKFSDGFSQVFGLDRPLFFTLFHCITSFLNNFSYKNFCYTSHCYDNIGRDWGSSCDTLH